LLALLVVLATALSYAAPAQAQNATGVCERTEEVETEIVDAVAGVGDCANLTAAQLAAREIAEEYVLLSARDCLHLAVMRAQGVNEALTFDRGFSAFAEITILA